jgi:hypothetical protein
MNKRKPGRPLKHGMRKRQHGILVTDTAWQGLQKLAKDCNVSVSEYLEQLGQLGNNDK